MPIKVAMPSVSPTMTKGNLTRWLVKVGDTVKQGDAIAEIETDKASIEIESTESGVVGQLVTPEGSEDISVGEVILLLLEQNEEAPVPIKAITGTETATGAPGVAIADIPADMRISPLARRMAQQARIDVSGLKGGGPNGCIIKEDIEAAIIGSNTATRAIPPLHRAAPPEATTTSIDTYGLPPFTRIPNSLMRNVIATRLTESSRTIPHFYMWADCRVDCLLKSQQDMNMHLGEDNKLSLNDFIIMAVAATMKKVPEANRMWANDSVLQFQQVDIAIAVSINEGLITPVIRNVNGKRLAEVSCETRALVGAARAGKLKPADYQGGAFTLSNLGMFGIENFTSIINPPQSGILSVGACERRPVVIDDELAIATMMTVTLGMDHRCMDGVVGARFIQTFKTIIECPVMLML
jgi:pyruvate dehydrogenase E2 component (dihydrolipoamide acetyltransferase)